MKYFNFDDFNPHLFAYGVCVNLKKIRIKKKGPHKLKTDRT